MRKVIRPVILYTSTITLLGLLTMGISLIHIPKNDWRGISFLLFLSLAAEALPVSLAPIVDATVSISYSVTVASLILYGPAAATLIASLGTIRLRDFQRKVPLHIVLYNRGQLALSSGVAAVVYSLLSHPGVEDFVSNLFPLALFGGLTYIFNIMLVGAFLALEGNENFWHIIRQGFQGVMLSFLALLPIGILMAIVLHSAGPLSVGLLFVPLLLARQSFQRYRQMREVCISTIKALTSALDAKDSYTRGHSERVARYAVGIAKNLGLSEEEIELIEYMGLLHDIGKIGIRDSVLKKPGFFTADEYQEMKGHSVIGASIIADITHFAHVVNWVRYHHERFDGKGYPEGIAGKEIPLGARIIAVADAFDAMTSDRPYKKGLDIATARQELQNHAGSQFDPDVVKAMVQYIDKSMIQHHEVRTSSVAECRPSSQGRLTK